MKNTLCVALLLLASFGIFAQEPQPAGDGAARGQDPWSVATFSALRLRAVGPALMSGRISHIAVHPGDKQTWYVGVASGGVWKTTNAGTTWTPIFDDAGSYSVGAITIDPNNSNVIWVGSGEHNSQRSVSYGDGVYRSEDAGKSFTNMGLKDSEHIGRVLVDPRDSNVVYVAAHGPLWRSGGDRGLYKSTDGGKTWAASLTVSENTGVTDAVMDPRNPDLLYAASYQRRRHEWGLVHGGPEAAFYRSTDAGKTWQKVESGLPKEDKGRIAIAVPPTAPDTVYLAIEAADGKGGLFRSTDRGVSFSKQSGTWSTNGQYYTRLYADPRNASRLYLMDTFLQVSDDAGKTFHGLGESYKHVDNHAIWADPADPDHYLVGCDGGLYETHDRAANWSYFDNVGAIQFYKIAVDDARPFYNVYGGTQDNFSLGGPSRTNTRHGITNRDWFVVTGGDGFEPQVDPTNPDIVYAEAQHGALVRFDRKTGEELYIQPQPEKGEILKWNWDSPLLISPHSPTRLYFAANRLFRSDDRGNSWRGVSGDLTRGIDRNTLPMMGKVWSVDAVAKNANTTFFGNATALDESPRVEGLLYVGTDDGLVQVSEDAGGSWRRVESFPGVPAQSYVANLTASRHADGTVFAALNNFHQGDFKPYLLRSTDRGRTWASIASDLPERGSTWDVVEDHVDPKLLFCGTEFGVYTSVDGGAHWLELGGGLPTIAARDLEIQRRENDLVVGTFGRGIYILDDYTPLRALSPESVKQEAALFPVKTTAAFVPASPLGEREKSFQGDGFFAADNPPFGAVFTYYLEDELLSRKKARLKAEKETEKAGGTLAYPSWDALRAEDREEAPTMVLTVADADGNVVRRLEGPVSAGIQRVAWDLRLPAANPVDLSPPTPTRENPYIAAPRGPMVPPGRYTVTLAKRVDGVETTLGAPQPFEAIAIGTATLPNPDREALFAFTRKTARLQRAALGAEAAAGEAKGRLDHLKQALAETPGAPPELAATVRNLETRLADLEVRLSGDSTIAATVVSSKLCSAISASAASSRRW